jgi:hypothetical protein
MREADTAWKEAGTALQNCLTEKAQIQRQQERIRRDWAQNRIPLESEEAARRKMADLDDEAAQFDREIQRLESLRAQNVRDWRDASERKGLAQQLAELANARQAEIKKRDDESLRRFGNTLFGMMDTVAGEGTDKVHPKLLPKFKEYVKREAMLRLSAPGTDLDQQDVPAFVREVKTEFLALVKESHSAQSAVYSEGKTADMAVKAPEGKKAVAAVAKTSKWSSQEELDAHLDQALGL